MAITFKVVVSVAVFVLLMICARGTAVRSISNIRESHSKEFGVLGISAKVHPTPTTDLMGSFQCFFGSVKPRGSNPPPGEASPGNPAPDPLRHGLVDGSANLKETVRTSFESSKPRGNKSRPRGASPGTPDPMSPTTSLRNPDPVSPSHALVNGSDDLNETERPSFGSSKPRGSKSPPRGASPGTPDPVSPSQALVDGS